MTLIEILTHKINIKLFYVYLAGPIEQDTDDGGQKWRDSITVPLDKCNICVQDPCKTEPLATGMDVVTAQDQFNKWIKGGNYDIFAKKFKVIVDKDMRMVHRSDFIIVRLFPGIGTTGTIHEMAEAWRLKKPIYLIYYGAKNKISKWALYLTTNSGGRVFDNRKQCVDYIEAITNSKILSLRQKIVQYIKGIIRGIEGVIYERKVEKIKRKNETSKEKEKRLKIEKEAEEEINKREGDWPRGQKMVGDEDDVKSDS